MSIIGFACPHCHHQVALDHYETSACGAKLHPDYAMAVLHDQDDRYVTGVVEVTSGLGCPRSRAIERDADVFVNPLDYNALLIGRAWDTHMEKYAPEDSAKLQLKGVIAGVEVNGELDRVRTIHQPDGTTVLAIEDHKHSNNFQKKFTEREGVKPENVIQTSIYAELYDQTFKCSPAFPKPTHGLIWYHYSGANTGTGPLLPFLYELWPLEKCLAFKPYGGEYTVEQLYHQAGEYYGKAVTWEQLPLVGVTMAFGPKSYCDYCQVRTVCMEQNSGAPF